MLAASILLVTTALGPKTTHKAPAWLDYSIATYILRADETHEALAVFDAKTGYFLIRDNECDGGIITLILTKDRNEVANLGYRVPNFKRSDNEESILKLTFKSLPSLSTGLGIRIGDSEATLTKRFGKPKEINISGSRDQFTEYNYKWKTRKDDSDGEFDETYIFKAGKLIEIMFVRDFGA